MKFFGFILFLSAALQSLPALSSQTSLVVRPVLDGEADAASRQAAQKLQQALAEEPTLYLVDTKKVEAVLRYYQGWQFSSPQSDVETAKELLARAKEHYFQFAYPEAEAELARVEEMFRRQPEWMFTDGQLLVDSAVTQGLIFSAEGKTKQASSAFERALRLAPFYPLDRETFSPSVRRLLRAAKEKIEKSTPAGAIRIEGQPKVAEIYLNGIYQGVSPKTLAPMPPGEYALSFRAHHYQTMQKRLQLAPQETVVIRHQLYWEGLSHLPTQTPQPLSSRRQMEEGLRIAELLKADKVLWVDVDAARIETRLIDREYRAAHRPILLPWEGESHWGEKIPDLARLLFAQTRLDLMKNPQAYLDPNGLGDPILLSARRRRLPKGALAGTLGAFVVGGILAAVLSAGEPAPAAVPTTGSLQLNFR